jgi:hypothetical protein
MKKIDLGQILNTLANLGVIAGIVFLAMEIRQTNSIAILDARTTELDQYNNWRMTLVEDDLLSDIWTRGLAGMLDDPLEIRKFQLLCMNYVWLSVTAWERGVELGRQTVVTTQTAIRGRMLREDVGFQDCWDYVKDSIIEYGLSDYVDQVEAVAAGSAD